MYSLIECSDNYEKSPGNLWKYFRDEPGDTAITNSESFKSKMRTTRKTLDDGNTKHAEITVTLKFLTNFWRTLEISLNNCKISSL